ncbi:hypothetical protein ACWELO_33645 [Streptomyces sp. NPDC004596]
MDDRAVERTDEPRHVAGPWWADLGTWGAVALVVLGGVAAAWVFLDLPGAPQEPAFGYRVYSQCTGLQPGGEANL